MPEIIVKLGDSIVQKYFFVRETMSMGRAPDNEIVIENLAISRNHAVIRCEDEHYYLQDMGSANGTYVNGVKVKKTELMDRDVITLGKHKLYFYDQRAEGANARRAAMADIDHTMLIPDAAQEPPPPPRARLLVAKGRQKGTMFELDGSCQTIGRGPENALRISDWFVSRQHAQIERRGNEFVVRDLGSWRHTVLNGTSVEEAVLADGDTIQLGPTTALTFQLVAQPAAEPLAVAESRRPVELAAAHGDPPTSAGPAFAPPAEDDDAPAAQQGETPDFRIRLEPELDLELDRPDEAQPAAAALGETEHNDSVEVSNIQFRTDGNAANGSAHHGTNGSAAASAAPGEAPAPQDPEGVVNEIVDYSVAAAAEATHDPLLRAAAGQPEPVAAAEPELADETPDDPALAFEADEQDEAEVQALEAEQPDDDADHLAPTVQALDVPPLIDPQSVLEAEELEAFFEAPAAPPSEPEAAQEISSAPGEEAEPEAPAEQAPAEQAIALEEAAEAVDAPAAEALDAETAEAAAQAEATTEAEAPAGEVPPEEIAMWERALQNKSPLIRKQAARRLKQLTGKDYAY